MEIDRSKNNFLTFLLISLLLLISAWIAFDNTSHSLWYDEAVTAKIVDQDNLDDVVRSSFTLRPYPPLYFLVTHYSSRLFEGEFGLRLPSIVFGLLAVLSVFLLGRALFNNSIGLLSALLFVTTPAIFRYFVDANGYSLLAFSITAATYCCYIAVTKRSNVFWICFTFFSLVSLATHFFGLFHVIANIVAAYYLSAALEPSHENGRQISILRLMGKQKWLTTCSIIIICVWILWIIFYFRNQGVTRSAELNKILSLKTLILLISFYFGFLSKGTLLQIVVWPFLQLLGFLKCFIENKVKLIFILIIIIIPTFLITISQQILLPFFAYRYGIGFFGFACILSANSVYLLNFTLINKARYRFAQSFVSLALLSYVASGIVVVSINNDDLFEIQQWRQAAQYLESRFEKEDILYFVHDWQYPSLEYYFEAPSDIYLVKNHVQLIKKLDDELREDSIFGSNGQAKRIWIVLNSLENKNAAIEKFFGGKISTEEKVQILAKDLESNFGVRHIEIRKYRRVAIVSFEVPDV